MTDEISVKELDMNNRSETITGLPGRRRAYSSARHRIAPSSPPVPEPTSTPPGNLPRLIDVFEAAHLLCLGRVDATGRRPGGVRTLRHWVATGHIPYHRAHRRLLFDPAELVAWTKRQADREQAEATVRRLARHSGR